MDVSPLSTGPDGIAEFDFTVGPGANTVVVTGIGVGTAESPDDDGNPLNNVFAPLFKDVELVGLAIGTLTFTATGTVPLVFKKDPGDARLGDGGNPLA